MSLAELGFLRWLPPLLDPAVTLDPFAGVSVRDGTVVFELASGAVVPAAFSSPATGVLHVRIGASGGVAPTLDGAAILIEDGDVRARIHPDGSIEYGSFRRAGGPPSMRSTFRPGRLQLADGRVGWLEAAALTPDEQLYGSGETFQGPALRGRIRRVANAETHGAGGLDVSYLNVPLFWSDRGWGLLFDSGAPVIADLGSTQADVATFAVEGEVLDVFVLSGSPTEILRGYHAVTGLPGRLPDWAFGVWMSRCSYLSETEIHGILDELEAGQCPVDVVHVDAWVSGNVIEELTCNWTVDRERFPSGWVDRLRDRGVRVSLWHNPYVLVGSPRAKELEAAGLLLRSDNGGLAVTPDKQDRNIVDFTNPAAVEWWQARVRETVATEHNHAFKPDFAEEIPEDARFHDGRSGRELRNEYAVLYQAATHGALADAGGAAALFCRSGTSGAQRYPCHWVGDTPSTWSGLADALRASLSLSLSGFAFVAHDVGGFWVDGSLDRMFDAFARMDGSVMEADVEPELFARWAQFGALTPLYRFHGTSRREPTAYPEPARSAAIDACRLRKRLEAYLVRCAEEAVTTGVPLMRPMPLAYPEAREARDALQYLLGPDILVAPLLEQGGRRRLWAPPGAWEPLAGAPRLDRPGYVEITCAIDQFPVWLREGASLDG